jgi:hypothetical protein
MSHEDEQEFARYYELEESVRRSLPGFRTPSDFRKRLGLTLRSNFVNQRRGPSLPAIALLIGGLAVALLATDFVVSGGFRLISRGIHTLQPGNIPVEEYEDSTGQFPYITEASGPSAEILEQVHELHTAGQGRLVEVTGLTIDGTTSFFCHYEFDVDGQIVPCGFASSSPATSLNDRHLSFMQTSFSDLQAMLAGGSATHLSPEQLSIDGHSLTFERWLANFAEYGDVVYWQGVP